MINPAFFKGLQYWQKLTRHAPAHSYLVYGGTEMQQWSKGQVLGWKNTADILGY